jgi:tetratricopeptide (TPR) repeat protein
MGGQQGRSRSVPGPRACRKAGFAALPLIAVLFSACLSPLGIYKYGRSAPKSGHLIAGVPYEKWKARNYCGPACLAMVLDYWAGAGSYSQERIGADVYDPVSQGTYSSEMVLYPRTLGFMTHSFRGDLPSLKAVVSRDIPVIVLTKPIRELDKGHYRVVVGFDEAKRRIIFHDPYFGERCAVSDGDFLKLWERGRGLNDLRWGMAVVPAGRDLPFPSLTGQPHTSVNLATAYYRKAAYASSREQWLKARELMSGDPYPLYSLGMVSLKMENAAEAEAFALEALKIDENSAYALDVLGLAYAEQGRTGEALTALSRAVLLAPDELFIRDHYLQVRAIHTPKLGLEYQQKKGGPD